MFFRNKSSVSQTLQPCLHAQHPSVQEVTFGNFLAQQSETREPVGKSFLLQQMYSFDQFPSSKNLEKILSKPDLLPRRL